MKQHLEKLHSRPLSWSSLSSFRDYDKKEWAKRYLDGIYDEPNSLMKFGNEVGDKIASDPKYLPSVERYSVFEKKLLAGIKRKNKEDIKLVGLMDSFDPETCHFYEYKTSSNKTKWNIESAQEHGQILFYLYLIYANYRILPEKIRVKLFYIPVFETGNFDMAVDEKGIKSFEVSHSSFNVAKFGAEIKKIYEKMEKFALAY